MSDFDKEYTCPICGEEDKICRLDSCCEDCARIFRVGRVACQYKSIILDCLAGKQRLAAGAEALKDFEKAGL